MMKIVTGVAALAVLTVMAMPGTAGAAERRADGVRTQEQLAPTEFSSQYRRWHRRHFVRHYWGPPFYAYDPYYPYYYPYRYYRPRWYGPHAYVGIGPFGF